MIILSTVSAIILSVLASVLEKPKAIAKELDRSKQMMIAAKILDHNGHFLLNDPSGTPMPAKYDSTQGRLIAGTSRDTASQKELIAVYQQRFQPFLVDEKGQAITFEAAQLQKDQYIASHRKSGYHKQPYKLIYKILPNPTSAEASSEDAAEGWVIPINGYGLWDAIYGYLAIKPDGLNVIGTTWYDQKETPGLGANIADPPWQELFPGKQIFQASANGQIDLKSAPLGITVVRGKVSEVYGDSPKGKSAVDGMAGATLTGNGVTDAYSTVLEPYRQFLMRLHSAASGNQALKKM